MNLLNEPWMPVRKRDGSREWVNPSQLSRPDIVAFDADRADFNGALAQFAIGLLQTTTPVERSSQWRALFKEPPGAETLSEWFAPVRAAFEFDGDGARFMQDLNLTADDGAFMEIAALLIETPGENTLKNNADHFVKRNAVKQLCMQCTAVALFSLQLNAPSGGAGHRTGLRGGGPLTTLLLAPEGSSLWHHLWLNVIEREQFADEEASERTAPRFTFPWLATIAAIQKEAGETAPVQTHPAHVFWAMPRRIRLSPSIKGVGQCDVCHRECDAMVTGYRTRNYGLNYKGPWNHPLSPYYEMNETWLPLHPQPGGLGSRHWLAWVIGQTSERKKQRRARVVEHFLTNRTRTTSGALRLWAFGYDMDNMKARCWYESTLPLYDLGDTNPNSLEKVEAEVGRWLDSAEQVAFLLRGAVKDAWFKEAPARADFSAIDTAFWSGTEAAFYTQLRDLIGAVNNGAELDITTVNNAWLGNLRRCANQLFTHQFVGAGPVEHQPRRIALAHNRLQRSLNGPKLREALGLMVNEPESVARKVARDGKSKGGEK